MTAAASSPIHLTILRRGDTNIIDLDEVDALIPRSETQVDNTFLQELATEVMHLATPGRIRNSDAAALPARAPSSGTAVRDLQRIGSLIFSHLLTEPARKRLHAADACDLYLRLDEQLVHLPWELCYDGSNFLSTKFRVGRQIITGYPIPASTIRQEPRKSLRVLVIADPTESLPEAGAEADHLSLLLDDIPGVEVTLIGGKGARKIPLLAALQDHDVVHFAGHSHYDPENPGKSGWRLHEGILTASEISKLSRPPLLVFSNSCQAGASAEWSRGYRYEGQAFGIGSAFLLAGVKNYIGTFWVVHDEESVLFASSFYQGLVTGLSLGDALLRARHTIIAQRGWQGLTWASYMLYGDPAFSLLSRLPPMLSPSPRSSIVLKEESDSTPSPSVALPTQKPVGRSSPKMRRSRLIALLTFGGAVFAALFFPRIFPAPVEKYPASPLQRTYEEALTTLQAGKAEQAFSALQRLAALPANESGLGRDGLAALYFEQGLLPQAKDSLQKSPITSLALLVEGDMHFSLGDKEKATETYAQATRSAQGPRWAKASAYNALGVLRAMDGRPAEARVYFQSALREESANAEAYSNLAYLAWAEGKNDEARQSLAKVRALRPEDELGEILSLMVTSPKFSRAPDQETPKILLMPFAVGGGNVRRLGQGEALSWEILTRLPQNDRAQLLRVDTLSEEQREAVFGQHAATIIDIATEKKASAVVWGELQSFSQKMIIYGKIWTSGVETIQRVSTVQEGGNDQLKAAASALAEKISQAVDLTR